MRELRNGRATRLVALSCCVAKEGRERRNLTLHRMKQESKQQVNANENRTLGKEHLQNCRHWKKEKERPHAVKLSFMQMQVQSGSM